MKLTIKEMAVMGGYDKFNQLEPPLKRIAIGLIKSYDGDMDKFADLFEHTMTVETCVSTSGEFELAHIVMELIERLSNV